MLPGRGQSEKHTSDDYTAGCDFSHRLQSPRCLPKHETIGGGDDDDDDDMMIKFND